MATVRARALAAAMVLAPCLGGAQVVLAPGRVFDAPGGTTHEGWLVVMQGDRIVAVGPRASVATPAGARRIDLPGTTLLPGLIDAHSHLFLHPYAE
ncbi:MAG TPA: hypothetical protein VK807_04050, partial [Gemmatimonadaceae bacterium]|nr:hypothetical protein [Gemmatimonadaceae bacterium]